MSQNKRIPKKISRHHHRKKFPPKLPTPPSPKKNFHCQSWQKKHFHLFSPTNLIFGNFIFIKYDFYISKTNHWIYRSVKAMPILAFVLFADPQMDTCRKRTGLGKGICFQIRALLVAIRWMRKSWRTLNASYRWRITQWNVPHATNPFDDSTWRTISPLVIHKK